MTANPIALKPSDRALVLGTSGTGKSTLCNYLLHDFRSRNPDARMMICDTKPRWRAEWKADGRPAANMYRKLSKGDTIPGSVTLEHPRDWSIAWDRDTNPSQTVILQRMDDTQRSNVLYQVSMLERFFKTQDARRPGLVYLDEGMDFFTSSATAHGSDIVLRLMRAGRERNITTVIGAQRPVGIPGLCITELNYCACYRLDYAKDIRRLQENGWPPGIDPPTFEQSEYYMFRLWRKGKDAPLYRLAQPVDIPERKTG